MDIPVSRPALPTLHDPSISAPPDITSQIQNLSLQDKAFLEELHRIEAEEKSRQGYHLPPNTAVTFGAVVPLGGGATLPGNIPGAGMVQAQQMVQSGVTQPPKRHEEVCELFPEEVRWFYKLEADKDWLPFNGYDSLRIEIRYRHIWQTRWRPESQHTRHQRRTRSLNRHHERNGAYSSSDEYNYSSDPTKDYYEDYRNKTYYNSNPPRRNFSPNQRARQGKLSSRHYRSAESFMEDDRDLYIVVRGGMYEVDLNEWKLQSVYWPSTGLEIMRGTWFHDQLWQPVDCEHADRIESEHINRFMGHKMADYVWDATTSTRREIAVQHTMTFPGEYRVEWMSPEEVYMHLESTGSKIYRGIVGSVGMKKAAGYRLFRGYRNLCNAADRLPDVTHIVFVVHGVGGIMDESTITRNASLLRDNISHIQTKCFPNFQEKSGQRVEFFPVEWRKNLRLDEGMVDAITPQRIMGLRTLLNSTAMDIMYYNSPLYRNEISMALQDELNRLYEMFVQRNPYFEANGGKVSIVSHSLGCVLTYDILTGWNQEVEHSWHSLQSGTGGSESNLKRSRRFRQPGLKTPFPNSPAQSGLLFRIENFFCLGSPLSVFLTLRWRDPTNEQYHEYMLPRDLCKYLYNIYHPCDPVAYRIEPIFIKMYSQIEPLHIYPYNEVLKMPYSQMPLQSLLQPTGQDCTTGDDTTLPLNITNGAININMSKLASGMGEAAGASMPSMPSMPSKVPGMQQQVQGQAETVNGWGIMGFIKDAAAAVTPSGNPPPFGNGISNGHPAAIGYTPNTTPPTASDVKLPHGKRLAYRMDYVLKETGNSYIAAVTSHTAYWSSKDIAYFILCKIYPELESVQVPPNLQQ